MRPPAATSTGPTITRAEQPASSGAGGTSAPAASRGSSQCELVQPPLKTQSVSARLVVRLPAFTVLPSKVSHCTTPWHHSEPRVPLHSLEIRSRSRLLDAP